MCRDYSGESGQLSRGCRAQWVMTGGGSPQVLTIAMTFHGEKSLASRGKRRAGEGTQGGPGPGLWRVMAPYCIVKRTRGVGRGLEWVPENKEPRTPRFRHGGKCVCEMRWREQRAADTKEPALGKRVTPSSDGGSQPGGDQPLAGWPPPC